MMNMNLLAFVTPLYIYQVTRNNVGAYPISMPSSSPSRLKMGFLVIFLTFYGMDQDHHTNISKYGV